MKVRWNSKFLVPILFLSLLSIDSSLAVSSSPAAICTGANCTVTFPYTGDYYAWTVPSGVNSITVDLQGAQGGSTSSAGGLGGRVQLTLSVTSNSTLYFYVGGQGINNGVGGYNGGGTASGITHGASGGGATDIRTSIADLNSRLVVAGGGGGASAGSYPGVGGAGGGLIGGNGPTSGGFVGGKGGTQSAGGAGGSGYCSPAAGSFGQGGGTANMYHCPAGGGGWYGGGQGAVMGGGGGSSYTNVSFASSVTHTQGFRSGNGQIIINYSAAPDTTAPTFTSSSSFSVAENIATSANAATIKVSESATVTISAGSDAALFNIITSDSITVFIRFKAPPDFEAPSDVGANNVYEITLRAVDGATNAGTQAITITVTDVVDTSSFNSLALGGAATFRQLVTITANVSVSSRVTFRARNIIISGCKNKLTSGTSPNIVATCSWRPSIRGAVVITASAVPTGAGISSATATPVSVVVGNRSGARS
jgi:hypothetical protein